MSRPWELLVAIGMMGALGCRGQGLKPGLDAGPDGPVISGDSEVDGPRDAAEPDGEGQDLPWPPEPTYVGDCSKPLIKLPIDMATERALWDSFSPSSEGVVLIKWPDEPGARRSAYYFDLTTCALYHIAWKEWQDGLSITLNGDRILLVLSDYRHSFTDELYLVNVRTWERRQPPLPPERAEDFAYQMVFDGNKAVVKWVLPEKDEDGVNLEETTLVDLGTGEEQFLSPMAAVPFSMRADSGRAAWTEYPDPSDVGPGNGRDALWLDLETGEKHYIPETAEDFQHALGLSAPWIVGHATVSWRDPPAKVWVYNIDTGHYEVLSDNEETLPFPEVSGHLTAFNTSRYRTVPAENNMYPTDVVLVDLETREERRVTKESGWLVTGEFAFPWLLLTTGGPNYNQEEVYALNIVEAGLTDAAGTILPGDGVVSMTAPAWEGGQVRYDP